MLGPNTDPPNQTARFVVSVTYTIAELIIQLVSYHLLGIGYRFLSNNLRLVKNRAIFSLPQSKVKTLYSTCTLQIFQYSYQNLLKFSIKGVVRLHLQLTFEVTVSPYVGHAACC